MSAEPNSENPKIAILRSILKACHDSLWHIYGAIDTVNGDGPVPTPRELSELLSNLEREVKAAYVLCSTIDDTSEGWPCEPDVVFTFTGKRSGYPVDLINGLLCKAEAITTLTRLATDSDKCLKYVENGIVNSALWGMHGLLLEVEAVINYDGDTAPDDKNAKAA